MSSKSDSPFLIGITQLSCRAHDPEAKCQYENFEKFVKKNRKSFSRIYYNQAAFYLMLDEYGNDGNRKMFSNKNFRDSIGDIRPDIDHIVRTAAYLSRLNAYTPVTWIGPVVEPHMPERLVLKMGCKGSYELRPDQYFVFQRLDRFIDDYVKKNHSFRYVSSLNLYNFNIKTDFCSHGKLVFHDGDHLSEAGEILFGSRLPDSFTHSQSAKPPQPS